MKKSLFREDVFRWWALFGTGSVAVVLGAWGSHIYLLGIDKPGPLLDSVYRALQLFGFNLYDYGPYPWQLEFARWLAPLVTLGTLFSVFSKLLRGHWMAWRLRNLRQHLVMIGPDWPDVMGRDGQKPVVLAQLGSNTVPEMSANNNLRFQAQEPQQLMDGCAITRSDKVLIKVRTLGEALIWLAALKSACLKQQRTALEVTLVTDFLQDPGGLKELARLAEPWLQIRLVNSYELLLNRCSAWIAQSIAEIAPTQSTIRLGLSGDALFCSGLFRSLAQLIVPVPGLNVQFVLAFQPGAAPQGGLQSAIRAAPHFAVELRDLDVKCHDGALDIQCFCSQDSGVFLTQWAALATGSLQAAHRVALVIPDFEGDSGTVGAMLNADPQGRLHFIEGDADQDLLELAQDHGLSEVLAQQIHENYLRTLGDAVGPAAKPWRDLAARYRDSTRLQVQSLNFKLACLGFSFASAMADPARLAQLLQTRMDALAAAEHQRWCTEKKLLGWSYGTPRDEQRLLHPCLLDYELLPEAEKEKDRVMWREILGLIEMARHHPSNQSDTSSRQK